MKFKIPFMIDVSLYDARRYNWLKGWIYDRPTDWNAARAIGIEAAAIKAGEGLSEDPAFRIQWQAASGRPRIAWFFFRQNVNTIAQANKFLSIVQDDWNPATDLAAIDWETYDGVSLKLNLQNGASWLNEVERELGRPPAIYTYPAYWRAIGGEHASWAKRNPIFLAQWPLDNWILGLKIPPYAFDRIQLELLMRKIEAGTLHPVVLAPWGDDIDVWQFTARAWTADIPGHPAIKKLADINAIFKPWWSDQAPTPTPIPTPTPEPLPEDPFRYKTNRYLVYLYPDKTGAAKRAIGSISGIGTEVTVKQIINGWAEITAPKAGWVCIANLTKIDH